MKIVACKCVLAEYACMVDYARTSLRNLPYSRCKPYYSYVGGCGEYILSACNVAKGEERREKEERVWGRKRCWNAECRELVPTHTPVLLSLQVLTVVESPTLQS